jgi:hypothetical protein
LTFVEVNCKRARGGCVCNSTAAPELADFSGLIAVEAPVETDFNCPQTDFFRFLQNRGAAGIIRILPQSVTVFPTEVPYSSTIAITVALVLFDDFPVLRNATNATILAAEEKGLANRQF